VDAWPAQGEIDIMEQTGWDKGTVLATVHTSAGSGGNGSTGSRPLAASCTAFHNYQIKWTPTAIDFYVDGVSFRPSYTKSSNPAAWPFDRPQYLLLNVAVGGVLGGTVNDATLSATGLEVDYVRVYQVSP
jgi:beta-glucanase (GH16 family)